MILLDQLRACGPTVDAPLADRTAGALAATADADGWTHILTQAWPSLAPIAAASPYLAGLMTRSPDRLRRILQCDPGLRLSALIDGAAGGGAGEPVEVRRRLRDLKAELHLLTALCDLGGVWDLDRVTAALSRFADAAVCAALEAAADVERARGRLLAQDHERAGPVPGVFVVALGKHGAFELNYSSDIDISVFFDPEVLPASPGVEREGLAIRLTQTMASVLQERTAEGYVFRVDLRLRPDPASFRAAVPIAAALDYYESVGQNWERAAMIKARPCAGDLPAAERFIAALQPFIWRRHLDYTAIADIHAIKRQIHVHHADERLTAPGADLKLGAGGIREIEFFVQTQQLILGGRDPALRARRTLDALGALADAGHVGDDAAAQLADAYRLLRAWEHRLQMLNDEQTHTLPEADAERLRVAALSGSSDLAAFDAEVGAVLRRVNARYAELFAEGEDLSSAFGSLVFTGVENDPETLATLTRMGFVDPASASSTVRAWHHGRIAATRTERGRELFTRFAPRLLEACAATGAADTAFNRFSVFFAALPSGVQLQSLFLAQPKLFALVVEVMAFAPELAATLARRPAALDALLDAGFFAPLVETEGDYAVAMAGAIELSFEAAMDAVRRVHREQAFRIGVQVMSGAAHAAEAGRAHAALADAALATLAPAALTETERLGGAFHGAVAVLALGKFGGREMTARSDLDLMTLYEAAEGAVSNGKGWAAETFYGRFTQRLIAAMAAPTAEGGLYEVDLQLRPTGSKGPLAVSLAGFVGYHDREAETWEALAMTRARVAWASDPDFAVRVAVGVEAALRRPRGASRTLAEVGEMRALMRRERKAFGRWDLKLTDGGLVDIEFCAQALQLLRASAGGPMAANTGEALAALREAGAWDAERLHALHAAWSLQQDLSQVLALALPKGADPTQEPERLRAILAEAGGVGDFAALERTLGEAQATAHSAFSALVSGA